MAAPPVEPVLPFAELLEDLRRQGFVVGLDQHLRLQLLLDRLADSCPPERLKTHLCPIFATTPEEQARFHRAFDRLYPAFTVEARGVEPPAANVQVIAPVRRLSGRSTRALWFSVMLAAVLAVTAVWWRSTRSGAPTPAPSPVVDTAPGPGAPIDTARPEAPAAGAVAPAPSPTPAPAVPGESFVSRHATALRWLVIAIPLLLFLLNEWRLYRRRRLVVERQRRKRPPFTWPVRVEAPLNPYAESADLPEAARHLRQRETGEVERLSVEETVRATIASLGFPTFRYRTDTRPPEYLLLIEREAHRDHRARLFQALAQALEREGVHTTRYFFDGDPRFCYTELDRRHELLVDLRRRYPGHRLLLFGSGTRLVDPLTGRLQGWTTEFLSWSDRALLTPEHPSAWGPRELALARHFVVLPATTAGLGGVVEHFRGPARPDSRRWQAEEIGSDAPHLGEGDPVPALRAYLGPRVFHWLCACAVYPELHWDLTLRLGAITELGAGLISEANLLRLLRLPWYREGAIPDEIRARLIDCLSEAEERAVREAIVELLERNPAPGASVAANRYELNLAVQRLGLGRRDPGTRAAALRELRGFPRQELVQDFAMVKLLEETSGSRLALVLPRRLRRLFYRDGLPALGVRTGLRMGAMIAVIGIGLSLLHRQPRSGMGQLFIGAESVSDSRFVVGEQASVAVIRVRLDRDGRPVGGETVPVGAWRVDPSGIVAVDGHGKLTALAPGTAEVTAVSGGDTARWRVSVLPTEFAFDRDSLRLRLGDVRALKLVVPSLGGRELSNTLVEPLQRSADDSSIVRVRKDGVIEVLRPGRAIVTVRALGKAASILIVVAPGGVTSVAPGAGGLPGKGIAPQLQRLESLRVLAARGERSGRAAYFPLFDSLLLHPTEAALVGRLRDLGTGTDTSADYTTVYALLKTHLAMSAFPARSTPGSIAPVLTRVWTETARPDSQVARLGAAQFRFYAEQLSRDNALADAKVDSQAVAHARAYLARAAGAEAVYRLLLAEAGHAPGVKPFDFSTLDPGRVVTVNRAVPGPFTRAGWAFVQGVAIGRLATAGRDEWVLGSRPDDSQQAELTGRVLAIYRAAYVGQWQAVLRDTRLAPFDDLADAARKIAILGSDRSPLVELLNVVSRNAAVDSQVAAQFQPALVLSPPGAAQPIGEKLQPYLSALQALGRALQSVASAPSGPNGASAGEARTQSARARAAALAASREFTPGMVAAAIARLLTEPIDRTDALLAGPRVVSLGFRTPVDSLAAGDTTTWVVEARDAQGNQVEPPPTAWRSGNQGIATVNGQGRIIALAPGRTRISVSGGGLSAAAELVVGLRRPGPTADSIAAATRHWFDQALASEQRGDLAAARADYLRALAVDPDHAPSRTGLTRVSVKARIQDLAAALGSRKLANVLAVYPGMPGDEQLLWRRMLEDQSVSRLEVKATDLTPQVGDSSIGATYTLIFSVTSRPAGETVSRVRYTSTFKQTPDGWIITSMRSLP